MPNGEAPHGSGCLKDRENLRRVGHEGGVDGRACKHGKKVNRRKRGAPLCPRSPARE